MYCYLTLIILFNITQLNGFKYVSQTIQLNINRLFPHSLNVSSIFPIDRTLSGVTIPVQSGPGSNGNAGVLHIPQSSRTGFLSSGSLMSYPGHLLKEVLGAEMQSAYSTAPADWAAVGRQRIV